MTERPVIVASNRGPVTFERDASGVLAPKRGSGGLVTALLGALQDAGGLWVAAAMSEGDREMAAASGGGRIDLGEEFGGGYGVRYLDIEPDVYDAYYNHISNRVLWFMHHYLWDTVASPAFGDDVRAAWVHYVDVNRRFAQVLAEEGERSAVEPAYLIQDYHLALVPRFLRELRPGASIAHFSHTSIAGPTYFRMLPDDMHEKILNGMLGADVLGFHSPAWAENFMLSARWESAVRVDLGRFRIRTNGRDVSIRVHPISVDGPAMRELGSAREVRDERRWLSRWKGDARLILRVDRLELSKNIVRGFQAYEMLLKREPSLRGRVRFLALLSPSRTDVPRYVEYAEECLAEAERVNDELAEDDWTPIELRLKDDYVAALAAYGIYDVLFVNPVIDGMNLVAMEGPLMNRRHGVLVLSRNAGAFGRLGRYAVPVNPFDVREMADGLSQALAMPMDERSRRARGLSRLVMSNPPSRWVKAQLDDLERALARRAETASI